MTLLEKIHLCVASQFLNYYGYTPGGDSAIALNALRRSESACSIFGTLPPNKGYISVAHAAYIVNSTNHALETGTSPLADNPQGATLILLDFLADVLSGSAIKQAHPDDTLINPLFGEFCFASAPATISPYELRDYAASVLGYDRIKLKQQNNGITTISPPELQVKERIVIERMFEMAEKSYKARQQQIADELRRNERIAQRRLQTAKIRVQPPIVKPGSAVVIIGDDLDKLPFEKWSYKDKHKFVKSLFS